MKKIFFAVLIALTFSNLSIAQYIDDNANKQNSSFKDRLFFGGILGLQFGSDQTYVEVAPLIGYRVSPRFSAGMNLKYMYYKFSPDNGFGYSESRYGGGPFGRFFIYEGLFAHAEYELLSMEVPDLYGKFHRKNVSSVFVGGGYRQMMGSRSALDLMILWNLNDSPDSPYINPLFHFGFAFGI